MGDRMVGMTGIKARFNPRHFSLAGGIIRVVIFATGLLAFILGLVGTPNDLGSQKNPFDQTSPANFYGYGLGYAYAPLNVVYICIVAITLLLSFIFPIVLVFRRSHHQQEVTMNRLVYLLIGLLLFIAVICGGVGSYNFWRGCCNVLPAYQNLQDSGSLLYSQSDYFKYDGNWCQCSYTRTDGTPLVAYTFDSGPVNQLLSSATPHHFVIHGFALGLSFLTAVLSFVAMAVI